MEKTITGIKNPVFSNAEGTAIDVTATHAVYGEIPFTASETDVEETGRAIYAAAMAGKFGEIAPYVPPAYVEHMTLVNNTARRDYLLREATTEAYPLQLRVSMGTATDAQKSRLNALNAYIIALDDMTTAQLQQSPLAFPVLSGGKN